MTPILSDSSMFQIPEPYQATFTDETFLARDIPFSERKSYTQLYHRYVEAVDECCHMAMKSGTMAMRSFEWSD